MTSTALYVGVASDSPLYLPHRGYVDALRRFGWDASETTPAGVSGSDLSAAQLVIYNGRIPEALLRRVKRPQLLIAMNGAGDNIDHYAAYSDRIAIATSSLNYLPPPHRVHPPVPLDPRRLLTREFAYGAIYQRRFRKYASPSFWRRLGVPLMYLPFAADPNLFHPLDRERDLKWCFVGHTRSRFFVKELARVSKEAAWPYEIHAPESGSTISPYALNELYNRCEIGINEQGSLHCGHELNERSYDLGMAGLTQVSDMAWMGVEELGSAMHYYSGEVARRQDFPYGIRLVKEGPVRNRAQVHAFFRRRHSFEARLATISAALGVDISQGSFEIREQSVVFGGEEYLPKMLSGWTEQARVRGAAGR